MPQNAHGAKDAAVNVPEPSLGGHGVEVSLGAAGAAQGTRRYAADGSHEARRAHRLGAALLAGSTVDCRRKGPDDIAFSESSVFEPTDARAGGDHVLVVDRAMWNADEGMEHSCAVLMTTKGKVVSRSPQAAHVLLGPSTTSPIAVVDAPFAKGATEREVSMRDPSTGKELRAFKVSRPRPVWETWLRDGDSLFAIEAAHSDAPATLVAIDAVSGHVAWARDTNVALHVSQSTVFPEPALFTSSNVHLFCNAPRSSSKDLCRFSRQTGERTKTFPAPVIDAARSASSARLFVLRPRELEAFTDEGEPVWKRALPEQFYGKRVAAGDHSVAVLSSWVPTS